MPELDAERRERLAEALRVQHFDGEGCGTYGNNACSVCHGPSPMSAVEIADALAPLVAGWLAEARAESLRTPRLVEADMAKQAADAWRAADARRGLADHEALIVHADALTRWSERLRLAFEGEDYHYDRGGDDG